MGRRVRRCVSATFHMKAVDVMRWRPLFETSQRWLGFDLRRPVCTDWCISLAIAHFKPPFEPHKEEELTFTHLPIHRSALKHHITLIAEVHWAFECTQQAHRHFYKMSLSQIMSPVNAFICEWHLRLCYKTNWHETRNTHLDLKLRQRDVIQLKG